MDLEIENDDEESVFKTRVLFAVTVVVTFWMEAILEVLTVSLGISGIFLWPIILVALLVLYWLIDNRVGPF